MRKTIKRTFAHLQYYIEKMHPKNIKSFFTYIFVLIVAPIILDYKDLVTLEIKPIERNVLIYIFEGYTKFIFLMTPVILAFSYFVYREQQSISLRHNNLNLLLPYFTFALPSVILSLYFRFQLFSTDISKVNFFTSDFFKTLFVLLTMIMTCYSLTKLFIRLFKGLNLIHQLETSRKGILKYIKLLYYIDSTSQEKSKHYFQEIHNHLEAIFQTLEYKSNNKMDNSFRVEFNRLSEMLFKIMEETPHEKLPIHSQQLAEKHSEKFSTLYKVIVRCIGDLIFTLYENNKLTEVENAFEILENLEPNKVIKLYPIYLTGIENISIRTVSNKNVLIEKILSLLESTSELKSQSHEEDNENTTSNAIGILLTYQSMLKTTAEQDDVRGTTAITYSMYKFIRSFKKENILIDSPPVNRMQAIKNSIRASQNYFFKAQPKNNSLEEISLYILLQATLKSIELGSYGVTGLLIKRITTDYSGQTINKVVDIFEQSKASLKDAYSKFKEDYKFNDLITNFHFNNSSYEYCLQKLFFLLLAQEHFIVYKTIEFTEFYSENSENREFIPVKYFKGSYLSYVATKVTTVGLRYGLAFFKHKSFIKNLLIYIEEKASE